jgi:tRNA(fMet)-specific endonuclease VapC
MERIQDECELATTPVNSFELFYGAHKSKNARVNLVAVKGFLSTLEKLEFDERAADKSGEVLARLEEKGVAIDSRDLFVGCTALAHGYPLLTNNKRHLDRIPELLVLTPSDFS